MPKGDTGVECRRMLYIGVESVVRRIETCRPNYRKSVRRLVACEGAWDLFLYCKSVKRYLLYVPARIAPSRVYLDRKNSMGSHWFPNYASRNS